MTTAPQTDRAAETLTTKTGKTVRIRTRKVGQNFGVCAELVARNGRVIASTDTRPTGCELAAIDDARDLAARI